MSKEPFKVGDRVRVYDQMLVGNQTTGTVVRLHEKKPLLQINAIPRWFHFKQCRRLKPKKKAEPVNARIERWINQYSIGLARPYEEIFKTPNEAMARAHHEYPDYVPTIHLVELREGEVIFSRGEEVT